ncbi:MAG: AI-2E family transporter [Lachnospiraceae bacterium]|nr:AI-2E family transporter [Lachnospiraceae bacterium]
MEQRKKDRMVLRYLLMVTAAALGVCYFDRIAAGAGLLLRVLNPLLIGAVIAYILNLVLRVAEHFYFPNTKNAVLLKIKRPVCILISLLLIGAAIVFIFQMLVPELISAIRIVGEELPKFFENLKDFAVENSRQFPEVQIWIEEQIETLNWADLTRNLLNHLTNGLTSLVSSTIRFVTVVFGGLMQLSISMIFAIYLLANKEKLARQGKRLMKAYLREETAEKIEYVLGTAHTSFSSFIGGQCTEAVILGSLCALGMWILRLPYVPMVGAFVSVMALIPIVGAYLEVAVGAFMIVTVDPWQALIFVVFMIILQQLEGNLIYPRVMGASIGLPGMWVLAAVTVGGGFFGIPGMLVGVPTAATLYRLLKVDVAKRVEEKEAGDNG